jgi:hypothetical protein
MDVVLSPVPMAVIVVLYGYAQLRSLIDWDGAWRAGSLVVVFGELLWLAYTVGSHTDLVLASVVLGCMAGLVSIVAVTLVRLLVKAIR